MNKALSIAKDEGNYLNEDAAKATNKWIAVSDGAGGGGLYADRWSAYLLEHLPDSPLDTYEKLDKWIGDIWEPFYNEYEMEAKKEGGLLLDKFYQEGSFATLSAVWRTESECVWMRYGDSVAFHYNKRTKQLTHSFTCIEDFNKPPFLINCKDDLNPVGFSSGKFVIDKDSIVMVASDALSQYIMTMYECSRPEEFQEELNTLMDSQTKSARFVQTASVMKKKRQKSAITRLLNAFDEGKDCFRDHVRALEKKSLLAHDDYSLAVMKYYHL